MVLQDNSAPDCLCSSSALSVRSLKKVAYVGKAGRVVPSTCFFFYPDRRGGFVACHRLQVSSLVSASGNFAPSRAIS